MRGFDVAAYWGENFSGIPPVCHTFRDLLPNRWVRFHSLPGSKRYPTNGKDNAIILHRYNSILDKILKNEKILLIITCFSESKVPLGNISQYDFTEKKMCELYSNAEYWCTIPMHDAAEEDEFPNYWHLYTTIKEWRAGSFDEAFLLAANDQISNLFILSMHKPIIFHPYDGGCDVILSSQKDRDEIKAFYQEWLSPLSSGL